MASNLTKAKAKKILRDGIIRGRGLTSKQKAFFGAIVGGIKKHAKRKTSRFTKKR